REAQDLIIKAWAEREPFAWNGKYTKLRYVNLWPQPIQKPHPPIWIPGLGSLETWDFCAEHGYNYSYLSFSGYKRAQKMMDGYWERLAARGLEPNPYAGAFFQQVCISDTDASCEREWWPHVDYFFNKCLHLYPGTSAPTGASTRTTGRRSRCPVPSAWCRAARTRRHGGRPSGRRRHERAAALARHPARRGAADRRGAGCRRRRPPPLPARGGRHPGLGGRASAAGARVPRLRAPPPRLRAVDRPRAPRRPARSGPPLLRRDGGARPPASLRARRVDGRLDGGRDGGAAPARHRAARARRADRPLARRGAGGRH